MFDPITLVAPCKINLNLHITGVRENGYHELDTVFLALPQPCDTLHVSPLPAGSGCEVECDIPGLKPQDNLVYKAWKRHTEATGRAVDMRIRLEKHIPSGAGLGGGSSDAATVLKFLEGVVGEKALGPQRLTELAAGLGADVPFFLMGGAARATGIGEKLTPVAHGLDGVTILLVCPPVHVSTPWAYSRWDELHPEATDVQHPLTSPRTARKNPLPFSTHYIHNDFEEAVFEKFPELGILKESLLVAGARASAMSGSGASVFALFHTREKARTAAEALGDDYRAFIHTL